MSEIDGHGPVLGEPSGGTLVALIHRDGHGIVARLDLDTGDAAAHVVPVQRDYARLLARTNSLVISDESSAVVLRPAAHTAVWLNQSTESPPVVLPAAAGDQAWLYEPGRRPAQVVLFDTSNGDTLGRVELPLRSTPVGTDPDGRLLLQADEGGTFRFDTDHRPGHTALARTGGRRRALGRCRGHVRRSAWLCGVRPATWRPARGCPWRRSSARRSTRWSTSTCPRCSRPTSATWWPGSSPTRPSRTRWTSFDTATGLVRAPVRDPGAGLPARGGVDTRQQVADRQDT